MLTRVTAGQTKSRRPGRFLPGLPAAAVDTPRRYFHTNHPQTPPPREKRRSPLSNHARRPAALAVIRPSSTALRLPFTFWRFDSDAVIDSPPRHLMLRSYHRPDVVGQLRWCGLLPGRSAPPAHGDPSTCLVFSLCNTRMIQRLYPTYRKRNMILIILSQGFPNIRSNDALCA